MYDHPELAAYATDRFVLLCIALFLEAIVGRISWLFRLIPHPFDAFRRVAGFFGRRLNKSRRGPRALVVRGAIVTLFLCATAMLAGWGLALWSATFRSGWVVDLALVMLLVSQRGSYSDASRTVRALTKGGLADARIRASVFHRGNVDLLDDHGICRAITEHLAGQLGRWLLAPVIWYLLLGLPGLLLYTAIIALSRSLAPDDEARAGFGWMAYRLEMLAALGADGAAYPGLAYHVCEGEYASERRVWLAGGRVRRRAIDRDWRTPFDRRSAPAMVRRWKPTADRPRCPSGHDAVRVYMCPARGAGGGVGRHQPRLGGVRLYRG